MTTEQQAQFLEIAEELGLYVHYRGDYSGRGMFGEITKAVVVNDDDTAGLVAGVMTDRSGSPVRFRKDDLGRDFIVY